MADLGNLYFDILFRDKTAEQRKKLKAEITKDLQAKLDVGFDKKKLVGDMKTLLQSEKFKINVVVDKTAEQRKKLKAEITKDLQAKLDVGFDKKKLVGDMKT
ncbi:hypothetical protein, partial [uncultured Phocaeicola sp.]|uniref:hypothetical protein n=2 Tax=uncultured Phocaeicola sp. TaxID=990718 RepID=UPI002601A656